MFQSAQIVIDTRDIGVIRAAHPLDDRQRPPVERLGLGVAPLIFVEDAQVIQNTGDAEVARPEQPFGAGQRSPVDRLGPRILAPFAVAIRQVLLPLYAPPAAHTRVLVASIALP